MVFTDNFFPLPFLTEAKEIGIKTGLECKWQFLMTTVNIFGVNVMKQAFEGIDHKKRIPEYPIS